MQNYTYISDKGKAGVIQRRKATGPVRGWPGYQGEQMNIVDKLSASEVGGFSFFEGSNLPGGDQ